MSSSLLSGADAVGLSSFTALRWLHCDGSAVSATNELDELNTRRPKTAVPMDLSSLTQLTSLDFTFTCIVHTVDLPRRLYAQQAGLKV